MSNESEIKNLKRRIQELERMVNDLARQLPRQYVRVAGTGGGGYTIRIVDALPAVPDDKAEIVFLTTDTQLWGAGPSSGGWFPMMKFTGG